MGRKNDDLHPIWAILTGTTAAVLPMFVSNLKQCDNLNCQPCGFETSRDLKISLLPDIGTGSRISYTHYISVIVYQILVKDLIMLRNTSCYRHLAISLQWRHNERDGLPNHQPRGCLLYLLFSRRSKKTSKIRVTGLCAVTPKMFPFDDVIMRTGTWLLMHYFWSRVIYTDWPVSSWHAASGHRQPPFWLHCD